MVKTHLYFLISAAQLILNPFTVSTNRCNLLSESTIGPGHILISPVQVSGYSIKQVQPLCQEATQSSR